MPKNRPVLAKRPRMVTTMWLHCSSPLLFDPVHGPSRMLASSLKLWRLGVSDLPGLRSILRSVATALSPLESALQEHRATSAQKVASNKKPAA